MFPDPLAVQVPPPAPTPLPVSLNTSVNASATVAPDASVVPAFHALIVSTLLPYTTLFRSPSVFVTARSAREVTVSVSVAELFPGVGSVTPGGAAHTAELDTHSDAVSRIAPLTE